ncbi:SseB N-terminal domain protein [Leptospira broomii serovar Hurstbridge str. 5399]|uniref:SseB N-terminal domain protein n=1 Tax=Leptospira broomii serovar Hurstbridge str. 5399 TaxID=1049789 RepID=T0GGG4_9LEPT|nr:SseB family protein [Leptospira broomii]EQA44488.1 SseB N-terminal domain protein [Leptospira broomii serovar Hurstbridge str. 5399]
MSFFRKILSLLKGETPNASDSEADDSAFRYAMMQYGKKKNPKNLAKLSEELTKSSFLVPHLEAGKLPPGKKKKLKPKKKAPAKKKKKEADEIVLLYVSDENGRIFLPAFSHPKEVIRYFGKETPTIRLSARDLWWTGLRNKEIAGVVIDPATTLWILSREHLEVLQEG